MAICNSTLDQADINEVPLWKGVTFHTFALWISAICGLIAVVVTLFIMIMHATHYSRPHEQRHIIRIVFMVPIYAVVSYLSLLYYKEAVYFEVLRDCYEAFAIASFFTLLCNYIAPTLHEQKEYFRNITPKNWFWSVFGLQHCTGGQDKGILRKPRSGLTWFNVVWVGVFQYCLIRVLFTIVSVIAQANDIYCAESLSPVFAHVWSMAFEALSVTIAMFCLIQFYIQLKNDLAEHKPFFKVLCIKLVIFLSFWQTIIISFLNSSKGPLQPTATLNYQDIKVGIPAVLLCIEMAIFSVMHIFGFTWKPYVLKHTKGSLATGALGYGPSGGPPSYQGGRLGMKAFIDAFNPWDMVKATARGLRWLFVGSRHRHTDVSYQRHLKTDDPLSQGYAGPVYASSNEPATELASSSAQHNGDDVTGANSIEDDRARLLRNQGQFSKNSGPYERLQHVETEDSAFGTPNNLSQVDLAAPPQYAAYPAVGQHPYAEDTGYHAVTTAPSQSQAVHPAFRDPQPLGQNWNFVAGANRRSDDLHPGFRPQSDR